MISVMKHVADQQKQQRPAPPGGAGDRRGTIRWSRILLERIDDLVFSRDVRELAAGLRRGFAGAAAVQPRQEAPAAPTTSTAERQLPPLPWASPDPPARDAEQQSAFYVERPADMAALQAIRGQGVTLAITGARQVGKTSLLARTIAEARRQGKQVLTLDFQLFDQAALADPDRLFRSLCEAVSVGLGIESRVDAFWGSLGNSYNCTQYFEHYLLERLNTPLVLALDKLERIPSPELRSSVFSMLRAWSDNRATRPIWNQLDLVLVTSSSAYQLVTNPYLSPFNTGVTIALDDFTFEQIADLNQRYGRPFTPSQQQALATLLAGHPYLIRQALYLAASGAHSAAEIIDTAAGDGGVFDEHLRYHLFKLCRQPRLVAELRQIISHGATADQSACDELCDAGLVRRDGQRAHMRCLLYANYFREHL
jgi:hypothetical protein